MPIKYTGTDVNKEVCIYTYGDPQKDTHVHIHTVCTPLWFLAELVTSEFKKLPQGKYRKRPKVAKH